MVIGALAKADERTTATGECCACAETRGTVTRCPECWDWLCPFCESIHQHQEPAEVPQ